MKDIINKKAFFYYNLIKRYNAGLILYGKEVKLIRNSKCNITKSYCKLYKNRIYLFNFKIHNIKLRKIELLLSKKEIINIKNKSQNYNYTIIPTKIFLSESGFLKLEIYLSIYKKQYENKKNLKKKEKEINLKRLKKYYF